MSFEQYLQEYEKRWNLNPRRPLKLQEYQDRTLYTTWDFSYARLENDDPDAAKLLKLLAYFDHQNIWCELLRAGSNNGLPGWLLDATSDPVGIENILGTLVEYCFVEVQWTTKSYSMHACVHDWIFAGLNKNIDSDSYWYAFDCVANLTDHKEEEFLGQLQYARLAPHARRLTHDRFSKAGLLDKMVEYRVEKAGFIAYLLKNQLQFTAAAVMYQQTLAGYEKALGPDHTSTLYTVNSLGILYRDQGKLDKAEQMFQRALAGYEKALGPDHTSTLNTVNNLGLLYRDQGKLDKAEEKFSQVLTSYQGNDTHIRWQGTICSLAAVLSRSIKANNENLYAAKCRIARLIRYTDQWGREIPSVIYRLARALFWIEDEENAHIPFSQIQVQCNSCSRQITHDQGYHVCRECDDTDLCNECIEKYTNKTLTLPACNGHEYFEVGSVMSESLKSADVHKQTNMDVWIDTLKEKYPSSMEEKHEKQGSEGYRLED
jgi:tetratricopeptide (TPR) repeat protein